MAAAAPSPRGSAPRRRRGQGGRTSRPTACAAAIVAAALALVPAAAAHVEVTPSRVAPLAPHVFVFSTPNERSRGAVVGLRVQVPAGLVLGEVEARPGWVATVTRRSVVWRGGSIPPGQFQRFSLLATATGKRKVLRFRAQELFSDGTVDRYRPTVEVAAAAARRGRDTGARTLAEFALGVALVAAAGVLLTGGGYLALWLTAPWETHEEGPFGSAEPRTTPEEP